MATRQEVLKPWVIKHGDAGAILFKITNDVVKIGALAPCACGGDTYALIKATIDSKLRHSKWRTCVGTLQVATRTKRSRHFVEFLGDGTQFVIYHLD